MSRTPSEPGSLPLILRREPFGGILFEIVTGLKPHSSEGGMYACIYQAMNNILQETEEEGELLEIALKALATKPEDRYASVKDFQAAIREYQGHLESVTLCEKAQADLENAREGSDYEIYAQAMFGFKQAWDLWQENDAARKGLRAAQLAYAECAFGRGDLDLAGSLLNDKVRSHRKLAGEVRKALALRIARQRRLKVLTGVSMAAGAVIVVGAVVAAVWIRSEQQATLDEQRKTKDALGVAQAAEKKATDALAQVTAERDKVTLAALHAQIRSENTDYQSDGKFTAENGQIVEADLSGCSLDTINSLKGHKLRKLDLSNTCVWDLTPVQDQPIKNLGIWRAGAIDSAPIMAMKELEELRLGPDEYMRDMDALRKHPSIKRLAGTKGESWLSPEVFWKKVDSWAYWSREQQECSKKTGQPVLRIIDLPKGVKLHMVLVPAGEFLMGTAGNNDREFQHKVKLTKPFYMGQIELTQEQWQAMLGENPSNFKGNDRPGAPWRPVEQVSWNDINEKLLPKLQSHAPKGMAFKLPTEAQWEYACRSGTTGEFFFGETISADQANYNANYTIGPGRRGRFRQETTPAGMFPPNAWGLHEMHGNVGEWCEDWYDQNFHKQGPAENPVNRKAPDKGGARVLRGGYWSFNPDSCRSAYRGRSTPGGRDSILGFRLCLDF